MRGLMLAMALLCWLASTGDHFVSASEKNVLVLGGNGFIGASLVVRLVENGHKVTIASRGNWYWDSKERVKQKVNKFIQCDRKELSDLNLEDDKKCPELVEYIGSTELFDAVYDLSAQDKHAIKDMQQLLKDKVGLYILVSSASIYDVCQKKHTGATAETDAVRPATQNEQNELNLAHSQAHARLTAEEALLEQRLTDGGLPFVIIRLPDVFGPRDTTYRFAIYHMWAKLAVHMADNPIMLPDFLRNFKMSLVYSEDVAEMLSKLIDFGPQIRDQAINLAYPEPYTVSDLVHEIQTALGHNPGEHVDYWPKDYHKNFYLYPTVRLGPVDVAKAKSLLDWKPTPFSEAVHSTSEFYEQVMKEDTYETQRNEIVQIVGHSLFSDKQEDFWKTLEEVYKIDLNHFRPRDEL